MNQKYTEGSVTLVNGSEHWYDTYVSYAKEMGVNIIKTSITAVDLDSSHSETIFQYENEEGFYINEMRASPDRLFWVLSENETVSVHQMDLSTGEIKDIETYDDKQKDILLQTDGFYLTWIMQTGEVSTIRVYDIKEDRVFDLTK